MHRRPSILPVAGAATGTLAVGHYMLHVGYDTGTVLMPARSVETAEAGRLASAWHEHTPQPASAVDAIGQAVASAQEVTGVAERMVTLAQMIAAGRLDPAVLDDGVDEALDLLRRLDRSGRVEEALRLAKHLQAVLSLARRWGDLLESLGIAGRAAQALGDSSAEAFVKHQLGSLALSANDPNQGARLLRESLREREGVADDLGAATTRHNLGQARNARRPPWPMARIMWPVVVAGLGGFVFGIALDPPRDAPDDRLHSLFRVLPVVEFKPIKQTTPPRRPHEHTMPGRGRDVGSKVAESFKVIIQTPQPPDEPDPGTDSPLSAIEEPEITGTAYVGRVVRAFPGVWTGGDPISYRYRWLRCDATAKRCRGIAGATGPTRLLAANDAGRTIRVRVRAFAPNRRPGVARSNATDGVASPPRNVSAPTVKGTSFVGYTLSASRGEWAGTDPFTFDFQWLRCDISGADCVSIVGATEPTYRLIAADAERAIRVAVSAANAVDGPRTARSDPTDAIASCDEVAAGVDDETRLRLALPQRLRLTGCTLVRAIAGSTQIEVPLGTPPR
jgi:hypothetical protein